MTDGYPWTARITYGVDDIDAVHDRVDQLDNANAPTGDLDGPVGIVRDGLDAQTGRVTIPVRGRLDNPAAVLAITDATVAAVKDAQAIADILGVDGPPIGVDVHMADPERHTSREDVPRL